VLVNSNFDMIVMCVAQRTFSRTDHVYLKLKITPLVHNPKSTFISSTEIKY